MHTGVPPDYHGSGPIRDPDMGASNMTPDEHLRFIQEQLEQARREIEMLQSLRENDGKRITDYLATIRTLIELSAHHWL